MKEYRALSGSAMRASDDGRPIRGLAAPFNAETMIGQAPWGFRETIKPGAFKKTLQERDVVLLDNHDTGKPLARKSAGSLDLRETKNGLEIEAEPADTSYGRDFITNVKAGNTRGMSFGFEVVRDVWFDDKGEPSNRYEGTRREIREVKLHEVSGVTFPAYEATSISARDAVAAAREGRAGKAPYGNVPYADPGYQKDGKKRYPIDTKKHVLAAWHYINVAKNAAKYAAGQVSKIKGKIKSAAKKFGVKISQQNAADWGLSGYCPEHGYAPCGENRCADAVPFGATEVRIKKSTKKRVLQISAELKQALDLLGGMDLDKLPQDAQDAVALVQASAEHVGHIVSKENLSGNDLTRSQPKPGDSTSADADGFADALTQAKELLSRYAA